MSAGVCCVCFVALCQCALSFFSLTYPFFCVCTARHVLLRTKPLYYRLVQRRHARACQPPRACGCCDRVWLLRGCPCACVCPQVLEAVAAVFRSVCVQPLHVPCSRGVTTPSSKVTSLHARPDRKVSQAQAQCTFFARFEVS